MVAVYHHKFLRLHCTGCSLYTETIELFPRLNLLNNQQTRISVRLTASHLIVTSLIW